MRQTFFLLMILMGSLDLWCQPKALMPHGYHTYPTRSENSEYVFEHERKGRVAFLGGSITYNPGWRDSVCKALELGMKDTEFEFIEAGIPSMGTTPSAFRLVRDVLSHGKVDLIFIDAAVNDATNGRTDQEQTRAMEGIIRHLREENPYIDIVMLHFVDPDKMESYRKGEIPAVIRNHNRVAEHYKVFTINLAKEVTDRIDNDEFSWDEDFKDLHPSPFGQGVYAHSIIQFLYQWFAKKGAQRYEKYSMPEKLDEFCYDKGKLVDIGEAIYKNGWSVDKDWTPKDGTGTRANYVNVPMLIGKKPGNILSLDFEGKAVGIAVAAGKDAGIIEFRIDQGAWQRQNLFTKWSSQLHLPWYYTLAADLNHGGHKLEMRILEEKDERSTGHVCRIRYFFVNGE